MEHILFIVFDSSFSNCLVFSVFQGQVGVSYFFSQALLTILWPSSGVVMGQFLHELDPEIRKKTRQFEKLQLKNIDKIYSIMFNKTSLSSIYIYIYIDLVGRAFANVPGRPGIQSLFVILKTQKMVLDVSLLHTQHYKVRIKGKVEQSRERSSALPYTSM